MRIIPERQWMAVYEQKKGILAPDANLHQYFTAQEIAGQKVEVLSMGTVTIPTGDVMVRDPLVYLDTDRDADPYWKPVPTGVFPLTASVVVRADDCARYAAVKVAFSDAVPLRYEEALLGNEDLEEYCAGEFFGFNVDAGLATIVDVDVAKAYTAFAKTWAQEHPEQNIYDDYFAAIFQKSFEEHPRHQRPGGDWINWTIPGTHLSVPMFQSGFGDGAYPVYLGYDANQQICQLVIQFIDIALAYEEEE